MGKGCKLYDPETGKSQKLGRYHKATICDQCRLAGYHPEDAPVESPELEAEVCTACRRFATELVDEVRDRLCGRCRAVFRAARALFKEGLTDEREIVPTLAFAASAGTPWALVK
jgi:hypothetical protein